jgi:hypothetical protein
MLQRPVAELLGEGRERRWRHGDAWGGGLAAHLPVSAQC